MLHLVQNYRHEYKAQEKIGANKLELKSELKMKQSRNEENIQ